MLRVAEEFHKTDTGLQRRVNEDALFARAPLFAVADGMGGAQAGEVASRIAVEALAQGLADEMTPERQLIERVRAANEEIHGLSQRDSKHAGMGTTLTAALLAGSDLTVAHVGDSRAYRLRDGKIERLTRDHSLVEELVRRGKLTEEEAEEHPQRSIITRALGPEDDVEVDTCTYPAQAGDLYLICSDGLTGMLTEEDLLTQLAVAGSLEEIGERLVERANAAGGRDNITVVLFRLEEVATEGDRVEDDRPTTVGVPVLSADEVAAARDAQAAPESASAPVTARSVKRERSRLRGVLKGALVTLLVLTPFVVGAFVATRAVYFVGTEGGFVAIYRGVPYELGAGLTLYQEYYSSGVPVAELRPARRKTLLDHRLRSKDDASDLVKKLERGQLE